MQALAISLMISYFVVIAIICLYGLHRYWLVWLYWRHPIRPPETTEDANTGEDQLPTVTVQLPMFNERLVAARLIEAACAFDYPADRLQVQVLDDSTDDSAEVARAACERMAAAGHDIVYIHRTNRHGYKAGALDHGMRSATGELVAVFDADFLPTPDILRRVVDEFRDEQVGMVQCRWSHLNAEASWFTEIQSLYLDGHFVVEQAARAATGRWFNFNGTAGIWRRRCIDDAGGWQHDTLTEDADLSYRAQLNGWRFVYRPDVTVAAEIPPTMSAFMSQQHRWNKGLTQTGLKLLPRIMRSDAPFQTRLEAFFHLTCPVVHVAILLLVLLIGPALFLTVPVYAFDPVVGRLLGLGFLVLGTAAAATFYLAAQARHGLGFWQTLLRLPALMAVGIGVSVVNTRAVAEALAGMDSPFIRTPKFAGARTSDIDPATRRRRRIPAGLIEVTLGIGMLACLVGAMLRPHTLVGAPFLVLFGVGFLVVGVPLLRPSPAATD